MDRRTRIAVTEMTIGKQSKKPHSERPDSTTPSSPRERSSESRATPSKTDLPGLLSDARGPRCRIGLRDALAVLALCLLVAVCYFPVTQAGFIFDDAILTSSNSVKNWHGLWQMWFAPNTTFAPAQYLDAADTLEGHYRPLVYTTFWLEHKLWGFAPAGYHIVNLLLHFLNSVLVWRLMQRLGVPGAWAIAAVFAAHPLHVESVAWVIERKDLLSGLCYLAAGLT